MPTVFGSVRRLLMAPSLAKVSFAGRGFPAAAPAVVRQLEAVPHAVVCGFEWGIDSTGMWELERRLEMVDAQLRGYAYEGATMACTVLDAMRGGRGTKTRELLVGPGRKHLFLCYIGIGFAMARLPRPAWRKVVPEMDGVPYHPTMSWLAVDGYGFDRVYFDTEKWIGQQRRVAPYNWQGFPDYFTRAADQGIGRALWFIQGGRVPDVTAAINRYATERRADLWSGVGLAATHAGGSDKHSLTGLREAAGQYRDELALGAVFAAKARDYAGYVPWHTDVATEALAGMSVSAAASLADDCAVTTAVHTSIPPYEEWRARIRYRFKGDKG